MLRFLQSHSGPLNDIEGFVQLIPGSYKSAKPIIFTGIDKVHLKFNFNNDSNVNGVREILMYSFALYNPPGYTINGEPRVKLLKKIKSVLSHIPFYPEDDDNKLVDFNNFYL